MQDGIFKREIGRNERDTFHTRTFIIYTRIHQQGSHAMYKATNRKAIRPNTSNVHAQSLMQFLLKDTAPQHAYKNKRKDLPLVVVE